MLQRAEESEKKLHEVQKKCDDYKRAYGDTKINLGRAQSDLEKLKNPGSVPQNQEGELQVKDKYEMLKLKYKVSGVNSFAEK